VKHVGKRCGGLQFDQGHRVRERWSGVQRSMRMVEGVLPLSCLAARR
jgi:hypothetical protein